MRSKVGERGQVTIPKNLRERLGIWPGQELEFDEDRGRLIVTKVRGGSPSERVLGILKLHRPVDELIEEMRGEPDAT